MSDLSPALGGGPPAGVDPRAWRPWEATYATMVAGRDLIASDHACGVRAELAATRLGVPGREDFRVEVLALSPAARGRLDLAMRAFMLVLEGEE